MTVQQSNEGSFGEVSFEAFEAAANKGDFTVAKSSAASTESAGQPGQAAGDKEDETAGESAKPENSSEEEHEKEEHEGDEDHKDGRKPKGGFQRRLARKDRVIAEKDRELAELRARLSAGTTTETKADDKSKAAPAASEKEPEPEDGESLADYTKRLTKWQRDQDRKADAEAAEKKRTEDARAERKKTWETKITTAIDELRSEDGYEDVREALEDFDIPMNPTVGSFLMDSEVGGKIACWLATHYEDAKELMEMGPARATRKLTEIEDSFIGDKDSGGENATGKKTGAAPVTSRAAKPTNSMRKTSTAKADDPESLAKAGDFEAFEKLMNKRQARGY